jgi:peroxiredoxin
MPENDSIKPGDSQRTEHSAAEPEKPVKNAPKRDRKTPTKKQTSIPSGQLQKLLAAAIILCLGLIASISFILARDTTPPVIQKVSLSDITEASTIITWQTDEPATTQVTIRDSEWQTDEPASSQGPIWAEVPTSTELDEALVINHHVTLTDLKPNTRYQLVLISKDKGGNEARLEIELTTPTQPSATPPVISVGTEVGKLAPDFTLTTLDGKQVSLSQFRGKIVMVNFWQSTCSNCRDEMPHLQAIYNKWPHDKLEILAVSVGEKAAFVQSFVETRGLTFPALLDSDEAVSEIYQISRFPTTFFVNADGIIKEIKTGAFTSQSEIEGILKSL